MEIILIVATQMVMQAICAHFTAWGAVKCDRKTLLGLRRVLRAAGVRLNFPQLRRAILSRERDGFVLVTPGLSINFSVTSGHANNVVMGHVVLDSGQQTRIELDSVTLQRVMESPIYTFASVLEALGVEIPPELPTVLKELPENWPKKAIVLKYSNKRIVFC